EVSPEPRLRDPRALAVSAGARAVGAPSACVPGRSHGFPTSKSSARRQVCAGPEPVRAATGTWDPRPPRRPRLRHWHPFWDFARERPGQFVDDPPDLVVTVRLPARKKSVQLGRTGGSRTPAA